MTFVLSLVALAGTAWIAADHGVGERTVAWARHVRGGPGGRRCSRSSPAAQWRSRSSIRTTTCRNAGILKGEYYVLGLFALLGIMVLVSANSLVTLYLGVELLALSQYAMVAFNRDSGVAAESAIKYFVLGAIASGALLYGMSIIYGVTGSLELGAIGESVALLGARTRSGCCSASHS